MDFTGIIAEYDPFHNGHAAQLAAVRAAGAQCIAVCMSSGAVQRGGVPILPESVRVRAALDAGADLVVALPAPYACATAEQFAAAGRITAKQQAALTRAYLVDYFRSAAPECYCTDETLLTGMMCRFADMNFTEQSQKVQQEYLQVYERRKARLQEQIDALQAKAEAEEMAVSMQEAPDAEPEMPELLPDETPAIEPTPEPLIIPMDPDIEPDIRMPEEMKTAA